MVTEILVFSAIVLEFGCKFTLYILIILINW